MPNDGGANAANADADRDPASGDDGDAEQPADNAAPEADNPARPRQEASAANAAGAADAGRAQRAAPPPPGRGRAQPPPADNEDQGRRSLRARASVQPAAQPPPPAARGRGAPRGGGRSSAQPSSAVRGRPRGSVSDRLGDSHRARPARAEASAGSGDPWTRSDPLPGDDGAADQAGEDMADEGAIVVEASPPRPSTDAPGARGAPAGVRSGVPSSAARGSPRAACTLCRQPRGLA